MSTRNVALGHARLIYKCEKKAHISVQADLEHHARLNGPEAERPAADDPVHADMDHEGHEVRVVIVNPGSAPYTPPKCRKCGGAMVLVDGDAPNYGELETHSVTRAGVRIHGLVDDQELRDLIAKQGAKK